jgi:hypothetical protein
MRKLLVTVVASCALVAVMPATALAHGRHHRGHHARVHHRTFGHDFNQSSSTSPTTSSGDTAGTVQSFSGGVLTIALNDGSTVSGTVSDATEIECGAPDTSSSWQGHDHSGDNNGPGDDDQGQGDDEHAQSCDSSNLAAGTVVREAELNVSSAGSVWRKVELMTASTSSSASSASTSSSSSSSCNGDH